MDCRRTDRTQSLFAATVPSSSSLDDVENEKSMHMRYSTISPQLGDIGAQAPSNEHIERLGTVLLTYGFYEKHLGREPFSTDSESVTTYLCHIQDMCKGCLTFVLLSTLLWAQTRN